MEEVERPLNDISEELKILLSLEEQIDLVNKLNKTLPIENRLISLNAYQITNLLQALKATGYDFNAIGMNSSMEGTDKVLKNNPLSVLNSGDWLGEIYNILKEHYIAIQPSVNPNRTALEYINESKKISRNILTDMP